MDLAITVQNWQLSHPTYVLQDGSYHLQQIKPFVVMISVGWSTVCQDKVSEIGL